MKKNNALRVAAGLMVAVLVSTCFVAGTFAKYTTNGSKTDSARVAKFGVTVSATDGSLFNSTYTKDDSTYTLENEGNSVVSQASANVVAPGTKGSLTALKISGTPEVAVRVTNSAEVTLGDKWTASSEYYCPLVVQIASTKLYGNDYTSADLFAKAIQDEVAKAKYDYKAGAILSDSTSACPAISWNWAFEPADNDTKQTDAKDAELGNLATAPTISIKVTTTVTQID